MGECAMNTFLTFFYFLAMKLRLFCGEVLLVIGGDILVTLSDKDGFVIGQEYLECGRVLYI